MKTKRALLLGAASSLIAGCGGDDQLDTPENVRIWMTTASAVAVYVNGSEELSIADGHASFSDPLCPVTSDDGAVLTITGGCTNTEGTTFSGSATVERSDEDLTLTFSSYGSATEERELVRRRGTLTRKRVSDGVWSFDANLVVEGGMRTTLTYRGSVSGDYDARTVWSGHGRVSRDGVVAPTGTIDATTEDEVVDDAVCSGQPLSGRTMIETEDQTAVVFYDGERDCDMAQRARYRVDGEERGTLGGIACSMAPPGRARGSSSALLGGVGVLLACGARRRRRARPHA
jgi:hypothetical protein